MIEGILYCMYGVVAGMLGIGGWKLHEATRRFATNTSLKRKKGVADDAMPSVTVCIPARNESHAMTEALQRIIQSTYPKLEIIVLDDRSGDKTPSLIKAFAQDGVRFIEGSAVPEGWIGKNHALNTLLREASGAYVLFMDVDTRIAPHTIERLVAYAMTEKAAMVSVLPRREDGIRASTVFSPLRYFWELVFHRVSSPAVASGLWLLDRRRFLADFTDFSKLSQVIQPEAHVAATYMHNNAYRFLIGTAALGVSYEKKWRSQADTSIRLLSPLLQSKIANALIVVLDLLILAAPGALLLASIFTGWWSLHLIGAVVLYLAGAILYGSYLRHVWRAGWWLAAALWPAIVVQEAALVLASTLQYRRGRVTWKGRLITAPRAEEK